MKLREFSEASTIWRRIKEEARALSFLPVRRLRSGELASASTLFPDRAAAFAMAGGAYVAGRAASAKRIDTVVPAHASFGIAPGDFHRLDPVPREGIERAVAIMESGEIFRYSGNRPEASEVALLERDLAAYVGVRHALGVNSCSQAIEIALLACGVGQGSRVLVPGFTFSAVPSAVAIVGATPVFVETTDDLRIDIDDLRRKIDGDTKVLLLSYMRGYLPDLDIVMELCADEGVMLIEDAAHALGARWRGRMIGAFGRIGCFSFQSNKIVNTGEGGVLVTDDDALMVRSIYLSGAYEDNCRKHHIRSPLFDELAGMLPLHNARMTNITAAMARPQLASIDGKAERYRAMLACLKEELAGSDRIEFPRELRHETRIPDSVQFRVRGCSPVQMEAFVDAVRQCGIPLAGFAGPNNARAFYNWRYLKDGPPELPRTEQAIATLCDLRLPSSLNDRHIFFLAESIRAALDAVGERSAR